MKHLEALTISAESLHHRLSKIENNRSFCFNEINKWIENTKGDSKTISLILSKTFNTNYNSILTRVVKIKNKMETQIKRRGRKKGETIVFYTKKDVNLIMEKINSGGTNAQIAKELSSVLDRTESALFDKIRKVRRDMKKGRPITSSSDRRRATPRTITPNKAEIELTVPDGISLEGKSRRVVIGNGYFKVYF